MKEFTSVFEEVPEGGYVCWMKEMPEAQSQGETLKEAEINLIDALQLVLEYKRGCFQM